MASTAIVNIGKLVSGDYRTGLLDADTVLIRDGKIAAFGKREDMDITGVDHVVDVKGLIVSPGLIDAHTHPVIGDWHPRHNVIGWMDGALHGGVTTIVSMGASTIQGRPSDPAGETIGDGPKDQVRRLMEGHRCRRAEMIAGEIPVADGLFRRTDGHRKGALNAAEGGNQFAPQAGQYERW